MKRLQFVFLYKQNRPCGGKKLAIAKKVVRKRKVVDETSIATGLVKVKKKEEKPVGVEVKASKYFTPDVPECNSVLDARVLWHPPRSPYKFIQEKLYKDPWRLLISTIFLNKTNGKKPLPTIFLLDYYSIITQESNNGKVFLKNRLDSFWWLQVRSLRVPHSSSEGLKKA